MKANKMEQCLALVGAPFQDLSKENTLVFSHYSKGAPASPPLAEESLANRSFLEDNIFNANTKSEKVLTKRFSASMLLKQKVLTSFFERGTFMIYFFREGCTIHDLRRPTLLDVKKPFPKVLKCRMLRSGVMLMLVETDSFEDKGGKSVKDFGRSLLTFGLKRESFEQPKEMKGLKVADFALVEQVLILLTGKP